MNAATPSTVPAGPDEPNWGNPDASQVRRDTTRAERIAGITWLSIGALFGLFISVLYIGARITIGSTSVPVPWTIIFALLFNAAITKTALLWTERRAIAGIPAVVWVVGFVVIAAWPELPFTESTLLPGTLWAMLLMICGSAGAAWPLLARLPDVAQTSGRRPNAQHSSARAAVQKPPRQGR